MAKKFIRYIENFLEFPDFIRYIEKFLNFSDFIRYIENFQGFRDFIRYIEKFFEILEFLSIRRKLSVHIGKCHKHNLTFFGKLFKSFRKSALRKNIIVILFAFSENGSILLQKFKLINAHCFITVLA